MLGDSATILDTMPQRLQDQLFAGRTRANCYFCFYQRVAEWAWLHDVHPDLFAAARELEIEVGGADRREKAYTWRRGESLEQFALRVDEVIERRAREVTNYIIERHLQLDLFDDAPRDDLDYTSCGVFCGK